MLTLRICPSFSPSFSHTFSPSKQLRHHSSYPPSSKPRAIRISCSSQTVEHIVLFNVKADTDPSKVNTMVNDLSSLVTLDNVLHLNVGPILRHRHATTAAATTSPELRFTHMLHSRYRSKEHLEAYNAHPNHVSVVRGSVFPIVDDVMAVDWVGGGDDGGSPLPAPPRGSAIRVMLLRLKEEGEGDKVKGKVLNVAGGINGGGAREIVQVSCGENFSPARAKGFSVATLAVFPGRRELERVGLDDEGLELEKVKEHVESVLVVDYVVA